MNTLQMSNLKHATQQKTQFTRKRPTCEHTNRKIFTFLITATYSLVPPSVNTFFGRLNSTEGKIEKKQQQKSFVRICEM